MSFPTCYHRNKCDEPVVIVKKAASVYNVQHRYARQTSLNSLDSFWRPIDECGLANIHRNALKPTPTTSIREQFRSKDPYSERSRKHLKQYSSQTRKTFNSMQSEDEAMEKREPKLDTAKNGIPPVNEIAFVSLLEVDENFIEKQDTRLAPKSERKISIWKKIFRSLRKRTLKKY